MIGPISRTLCTCREAAEILGCTMGRVRQLVRPQPNDRPPILWSIKAAPRALLLDADEVRRLAEQRGAARVAGKLPGQPPGGFQPDT